MRFLKAIVIFEALLCLIIGLVLLFYTPFDHANEKTFKTGIMAKNANGSDLLKESKTVFKQMCRNKRRMRTGRTLYSEFETHLIPNAKNEPCLSSKAPEFLASIGDILSSHRPREYTIDLENVLCPNTSVITNCSKFYVSVLHPCLLSHQKVLFDYVLSIDDQKMESICKSKREDISEFVMKFRCFLTAASFYSFEMDANTECDMLHCINKSLSYCTFNDSMFKLDRNPCGDEIYGLIIVGICLGLYVAFAILCYSLMILC